MYGTKLLQEVFLPFNAFFQSQGSLFSLESSGKFKNADAWAPLPEILI